MFRCIRSRRRKYVPVNPNPNNRRKGFAGRTTNLEKKDITTIEIVKYSKEESDEELIKEALNKNDYLHNLLEGQRLQKVVDAMYCREVIAQEVIIQEGSIGTQLYVSGSGIYEITIQGNIINTFNDNRVFGELAILYNEKRQATIRALESGRLWVLDQDIYQRIKLISENEYHEQLVNFLRNLPKLNTVSKENLERVANLLKREFFATGSVIIRQGDHGDKFYIISAGSVTITKEEEGEVRKMGRGKYFGQLALLSEDVVRQATVTAEAPGVECFSLSRSEFIEHFGKIEDIGSLPEPSKPKPTAPVRNPYEDIKLFDLKIIGTLGEGGFGKVDLVQHKKQKQLTFALKYVRKFEIVQQQLQEHVYNEKIIQTNCDCIFIVRMFKTFRDNKYLYFLMEACLGGDLCTLLEKQKSHRFEENAARFYAASVLEALAYLHDHNIVYRDLKPENIVLDTRGYLKLTDFGFAKRLGPQGKTYTFAGTPEYAAPEVVLQRGHDKAVDYWALGIFIHELLVGKTPFRSKDNMQTYNLILRGIDVIRISEIVSQNAENLIKKLCRSRAIERIGCQQNGAQAIREHKWFRGFDWNQLNAGNLKAPLSKKRYVNNNIERRFEKDTDIPLVGTFGWDSNF